ncbi:MAG: HI0074 family nucleotidyltransferase substrate-binding subunit [Geminicoccaceae bacterium]
MSESRTRLALDQFSAALTSLQQAMDADLDPLTKRDVVLLRFVFVFETCWKALKHTLHQEGIEVRYPKQAIQQPYPIGWIEDEPVWLELLGFRNLVAHTYNEEMAVRVYQFVTGQTDVFGRVRKTLADRLS